MGSWPFKTRVIAYAKSYNVSDYYVYYFIMDYHFIIYVIDFILINTQIHISNIENQQKNFKLSGSLR